MSKGILHVVSNVAHYDDLTRPTGLRLSELTHAYASIASAKVLVPVVSRVPKSK
jgi:hypothetical protein